MIDKLVLHPSTRRDINQFIATPSHSLLLVGGNGAGKPSLAKTLIGQLLDEAPDKLDKLQYLLQLTPINKDITIEQVREAHDFVKLRTTGPRAIRRAILVEDAQTLNKEAQNAFLKLLEEPPEDTVIVLTSSSLPAMLPTIRSRTQIINLRTPLRPDLESYFMADSAKVAAAYYMSGGQPGLMSRILQQNSDKTNDNLLSFIDQAKQLLKMPSFDRLIFVDQFSKNKQSSTDLIWALQAIANAALHQAASRADDKMISHWQSLLKAVTQAKQDLGHNPNQKLLLTNLVLNF